MTCAIITPTPSLAAPLQLQRFSRHELLPLFPDVLWRIEKGVVCTNTWNDEGTLITFGYWGAQDVVGQPLSRISPYKIKCLKDVEVCLLPKQTWFHALDAIIRHSQQTEELLSIVHRHPLQLRLWQFLIWLSKKFGDDVEAGRQIDLEITHQQMAEAINTTRVTVTRMLQQFEAEGKLRRDGRQLILQLEH